MSNVPKYRKDCKTNLDIARITAGTTHFCEKYCGLVEDIEGELDAAEARGRAEYQAKYEDFKISSEKLAAALDEVHAFTARVLKEFRGGNGKRR